jgi:hypothetical protein
VALDGVYCFDYGRQAAVGRPEIPLFQIVCGRVRVGLAIEVPKGEPCVTGAPALRVRAGKLSQRGALALRQVFGVTQPEVPGAFQHGLRLLLGAPHTVDRLVDDLHRMEPIDGDGRLGQAVGDTSMKAELMSMQTSAIPSGSP